MSYILDYLKEDFKHYCLNNDIINAQKIYDKNIIDINTINCEINTIYDIIDMFSLFECMCIKNHVEIVKWFITLGILDEQYNFGFISACIYNHFELAKYLNDTNKNIKLEYNHAFIVSCYVGNFEILKWLYNTFKINIHESNESPFIYAISEKHFDIAKWLYELSVSEGNIINIRMENDFAFAYACLYGRLDICKWLDEITNKSIDKSQINFRDSANLSENQELINWLKL